MSRSLWTIAELTWRQLNPEGTPDAKHTVEEYVETALDSYAAIVCNYYLSRQDGDLSFLEAFLDRKPYPVLSDEEGYYAQLEVDVMDLPRDMGVFQVVPKYRDALPLIKNTLLSRNLFREDPVPERPYYRIGRQIRFPEGFSITGVKTVYIALVSTTNLDVNDKIPDMFADAVRQSLLKIYAVGIEIPADETDNKNPDR